jgi:lactoylglutathione lyase
MSSDPCRQARAQIDHVALATSDLDRLCDFYRLLGAAASSPATDPDTGLRSCVLDFCGIRLELFERVGGGMTAADGDQSQRLLHLGFALESADAVDELSGVLAAAGHRVLEPPHRDGEVGRYESVLLDPDGNRVKLTV